MSRSNCFARSDVDTILEGCIQNKWIVESVLVAVFAIEALLV